MTHKWILKNEHTGQIYPLVKRSITIGRSSQNTITLRGQGISRHHVELSVDDNDVLHIRDLGSRNGTFINNHQPITTHAHALNKGDKLHLGTEVLSVARVNGAAVTPAVPASNGLVIASVAGMVVIMVVLMLIIRPATPRVASSTATESVGQGGQLEPPDNRQARLQRALAAAVLVVTDVAYGSGSVIDSRGYILTNAHVILTSDNATRVFQQVHIYTNPPDADSPAQFTYIASPVDYDIELDFALLKIVADHTGNAISNINLTTVPLGDSDVLQHQDILTIIGFPGTGMIGDEGGSVTVTTGTVAGFDTENAMKKAWIKTDAEISAGNSGGLALNDAYALVGVPTGVVTNQTGKLGYIHALKAAQPILAQIPD